MAGLLLSGPNFCFLTLEIRGCEMKIGSKVAVFRLTSKGAMIAALDTFVGVGSYGGRRWHKVRCDGPGVICVPVECVNLSDDRQLIVLHHLYGRASVFLWQDRSSLNHANRKTGAVVHLKEWLKHQ